MYKVSDAYKTAMKQPVQQFSLSGTISTSTIGTSATFTDKNILKGSFSITNQCCDESSVLIGQVYVGELDATFLNVAIPRYAWKEAIITTSCGLKLADGTFEEVPLGVFTIDEAKWTSAGVVIKAYDNMAKFDKTYTAPQTVGHIFDLATLVCTDCGVTFGMSQAECEVLPNGTLDISVYSENDIETYRDLISWLAQTCACNALIDRSGSLVFKCYTQAPVDTIGNDHRFTGGSFYDYETAYTGLSCVNKATGETKYYHVDPDTGLTYNLGSNPFLQYGLEDTKNALRANILTGLQAIKYVPFKVSLIGSPAYDLMDIFVFSDGLADASKLYCLTKYIFHYNGTYEMEGVGADPSLSSARSKTDKNISEIVSNVNATQLIYYSFVNAKKITVKQDTDVDLLSITFATNSDEAQVSLWWEAKLDVAFDDSYVFTVTNSSSDALSASNIKIAATRVLASCEATYLLNGNVQAYHPVETWDEAGKHTIHLGYYLGNIKSGQTYTFAVRIKLTNCTATTDIENVHALLSGTGLAGKINWDGTITLKDEFTAIPLATSGIVLGKLTDSPSVTFPSQLATQNLSDTFVGISLLGHIAVSAMTDSSSCSVLVTNYTLSELRGSPQYSTYVTINTNDAFILRTDGYTYTGVDAAIDTGGLSELDLPSDLFQDITEVTYK
jgi:hypothetical protein